jgi:hypothetical protein
MKRSRFVLCALSAICLLVVVGCKREARAPGPVRAAELGVFFGGQVQDRQEIPFCLDRGKQTQGFRLEFAAPLTAPLRVRWEIDRPGPRGKGRAVEHGEAQARVGMERFDHELPFKPGDPLGTWNVRVFVGDERVLDRRIAIYDARRRRELARAAAPTALGR